MDDQNQQTNPPANITPPQPAQEDAQNPQAVAEENEVLSEVKKLENEEKAEAAQDAEKVDERENGFKKLEGEEQPQSDPNPTPSQS